MKLFSNISRLHKIGIILSLVTFVFVFVFVENSWFEYRQTFECPTDQYTAYEASMERMKIDHHTFQPNWESIGDSLKNENVRRFELKIFSQNSRFTANYSEAYYDKLKLKTPLTVSFRRVGSSKAIGRSIGTALLVYLIFIVAESFLGGKKPLPEEKNK